MYTIIIFSITRSLNASLQKTLVSQFICTSTTQTFQLTRSAWTVASSMYFATPVTYALRSSKFVSKLAWYCMERDIPSMHGCWSGRGSSSKTSTFWRASVSVIFSPIPWSPCRWPNEIKLCVHVLALGLYVSISLAFYLDVLQNTIYVICTFHCKVFFHS